MVKDDKERFTLTLSKASKAELEDIAEKSEISLSKLLNHIIEKWIMSYRSGNVTDREIRLSNASYIPLPSGKEIIFRPDEKFTLEDFYNTPFMVQPTIDGCLKFKVIDPRTMPNEEQ